MIEQRFLCLSGEEKFSIYSFLDCWQDFTGEDLAENIKEKLFTLKWFLNHGELIKEDEEKMNYFSEIEKWLEIIGKARTFNCI